MNTIEHLFSVLGEECNEVGQICSKINRFGIDDEYLGETCRERLEKELDDVLAMVEMLNERGMNIRIGNLNNIECKKKKVLRHMETSRERGLLSD